MVVLNMLPHVSKLEEKDLNYFYSKDIYPLVSELSTKCRGVKFGKESSIFFGRYFIYFDGDDYARGIIHTDIDKEGNVKYFVASPYIMNARYRENSYEHYQLSSINVKTAVKNTMKYCRPIPLHQILKRIRYDITDSLSAMGRDISIKLSRISGRITYNDALLSELISMHRMGHIFKDSTVNETMTELLGLVDKHDDYKANTGVRMAVIHLHVDESVSLVRLPESTDDAWRIGAESYVRDNLRELQHHSELGEDIQGKIALLQMNGKQGEYVLGVGTMVSEQVWVVHGEY